MRAQAPPPLQDSILQMGALIGPLGVMGGPGAMTAPSMEEPVTSLAEIIWSSKVNDIIFLCDHKSICSLIVIYHHITRVWCDEWTYIVITSMTIHH